MANDASIPTLPTWNRWERLWRGLDWLAARQRSVLILGVIIQVLFLVAMIARPLITLSTGSTVLFRVAPVDPRDLFRGDYVTLSYDISRPRTKTGDGWASNWERIRQMQGSTVYVLIEPEADGKHWQSAGYQFDQPTTGKFIRGTVEGNGLIRFGIEQYFVQEGQGHDYENAVREKKLSAEVILDGSGYAQIKRLIIE